MDKLHDLTPSEQHLIRSCAQPKTHRKRYDVKDCEQKTLLPIIHYSNRRYYSQFHRRYITLVEICEFWLAGWTVLCVGAGGSDVTIAMLLQVMQFLESSGKLEVTPEQLKGLVKLS